MSEGKAVLAVSDEVSSEVDEPLFCQWCDEEKPSEAFKKNRHGVTRTCIDCFGARIKETKARKAAKLAKEVADLGRDDEDLEELETTPPDHSTEVLAELLATVGRACLNAAKRLGS
jgi:hypothetical protein